MVPSLRTSYKKAVHISLMPFTQSPTHTPWPGLRDL